MAIVQGKEFGLDTFKHMWVLWGMEDVMEKYSWEEKIKQSDAARFKPEAAAKIIEDCKEGMKK